MGANLWGGSPLWEYRLGLVMRARITTSRRQGQVREVLSGGSPSARGARLSPDRNSPEDCSCLAKGRASGSARPARHEQKTKFQRRLTCTQAASQLNRIQGRGLRGELAHDSKAHRYAAYGKCGADGRRGLQPLRRTDSSRIYRGRSAPRAVRVDGDSPGSDRTGLQGPGAAASCPPRAMNRQQSPSTPRRARQQRRA